MQLKKPCKYVGCRELITSGAYCAKHMPTAQQHDNPFRKLYGRRWRRKSRRYLVSHIICEICKEERSTEVDHIVPHRGNAELFWDESNWQALCERCHSKKTNEEIRNRAKKC